MMRASTGYAIYTELYDLIVLDLNLPGLMRRSFWNFCKENEETKEFCLQGVRLQIRLRDWILVQMII